MARNNATFERLYDRIMVFSITRNGPELDAETSELGPNQNCKEFRLMPTILPPDDGIQEESAAVLALDDIAATIYAATSPISHWGGDEPFDGVLASLRTRLHDIVGFRSVEQVRTERRRKVFGVRDSLVVFRRDGYRCVNCDTDDNLTVDHITPWSKGGSDDLDNLQTLCGSCNSSKGDRV